MQFKNQEQQEIFFIDVLGEILEGVLSESEFEEPDVGLFSSTTIPQISIKQYLTRLKKKTKCSNDALIMSMIYIDRYSQYQQQFRLSQYNIHRLLLTCVLTATKIHDDFYYDNNTFAMAGGIPLVQLNQLEIHLFSALDFRVFVHSDEFNQYKSKIIEAVCAD